MQNEAEFDTGADDDVDYVSKSQLKRESHALQDLGKRLAALSGEHLARMPLDDDLREAVELARRIQNKRSALKRQYQFIGKLLRSRDPAPIVAALEAIDSASREAIQRHHLAERWRDRILDEGAAAIDALLVDRPSADRRKLRQLWRNHQQAATDARRKQQSRLVYQAIRDAFDDDGGISSSASSGM